MKPRKWTFEKLQAEALKFKDRKEFFKKSRGAYSTASNAKILNQICKHMPEVINRPWTTDELKEEALKYNTRGDFQKNSNSAWQIAHNNGIFDEICSHMPKRIDMSGKNHPMFRWTDKKIQEDALKFDSRSDFFENSPAYKAAHRNGTLEEFCSHMKKSRNISKPEKELFNIVQKYFSTVKTLRDRKTKIENKPYIRGFDIDIFIPELNLGIEFDGKHHHSFKFMRNDPKKKKWSDDDIRNYHEIKDTWFATKGIKILHIKEVDWNNNKQACIDKCLTFLGVEQEKVA